jgi:response regulator of citrate/malate metabolism
LHEIFPEVKIFVFENGNDFLDQLNSGKLNQYGGLKTLVLLDINMPDIWGLDLLNNLDEDYENIEYMDVIMVSSSKLKSDVEKSSRYNSVLGYLEKPLNVDKISSILTTNS